MKNKRIQVQLLLFILLFFQIPIARAGVFETISVIVTDSNTGEPINGASVFLQIPSSEDANYSYYMANFAAQLPLVVNKQTNMDGMITYSFDEETIGVLNQANAEGMFTGFVVEVKIEHSDYLTFHEHQQFSVDGQDLSLRYTLQSQGMVPSADTSQKITIYVKDIDGNPITEARVTSISQPSGQVTLSGITSAEGSVTFDDVKTGSYTFLASAGDFESKSESLTTSNGEIIEKTILLEEKPKGIPSFPFETILLGLFFGFLLIRCTRTVKNTLHPQNMCL